GIGSRVAFVSANGGTSPFSGGSGGFLNIINSGTGGITIAGPAIMSAAASGTGNGGFVTLNAGSFGGVSLNGPFPPQYSLDAGPGGTIGGSWTIIGSSVGGSPILTANCPSGIAGTFDIQSLSSALLVTLG